VDQAHALDEGDSTVLSEKRRQLAERCPPQVVDLLDELFTECRQSVMSEVDVSAHELRCRTDDIRRARPATCLGVSLTVDRR
jgi:hypothetical protein